jgi:hypothetical protein
MDASTPTGPFLTVVLLEGADSPVGEDSTDPVVDAGAAAAAGGGSITVGTSTLTAAAALALAAAAAA